METTLNSNCDPAIADLIEQLTSETTKVSCDDLGALAALHTRFQKLREEVNLAASAETRGEASLLAAKSEQLLEKLILGEAENADAALQQIVRSVEELKQTINGVSAPAPQIIPQEVVATPHAIQIDAEVAINPDDASLGMEFISEASGHLESAEANLLKLEESRDPETINAIFRSFHTIKGVAGFLNLKQIGALSHAAENLLDLARKGKVEITGNNVDVVLESIDQLKTLLNALDVAIKTQQPVAVQPKLPGLIARLNEAASGKAPPAASSVIVEEAAPAIQETAPATAPAVQEAAESVKPGARSQSNETTVKVATDRLDSLINTVGELVIAQSMVSQDVVALASGSQRVMRNASHLSKITRELQDLSMSMRMVPIQGVFQKMARLSRDVARKAGKEIDFQMTGGETELDRNVVEAISDPLVHMVRNSVDHGVETPEQRIAAGKTRTGKVELKAFHEAGNIVIEIIDDGRGLNKKKLLEKAAAAGIITPGQELSEQEIFKLVFHAGLSTAEKITDISGRGVGMDVVRKNVEALRGRIDITSVEGKGTTFAIRLPLTLAVIDGLVVRIGSQRYIIPILTVEQSLRPTATMISTLQNRGEMCMIRGKVLPLFRLYKLFNVTPKSTDPTQALVVIVQDNDRRCCLMVDELVGQQQVVIKSLADSLGTLRGISGGAILGDGSISLILDVPGLTELAVGHQ
ncbi:MAG TPA: chemotaxis protein CheA [Tepidisphaeraceae bacterium]|jgi:two-component system chemotaxis sensor kinase CheA|nr:chemotaxis protein CheA [Tepidisphaeraceae bacterium]